MRKLALDLGTRTCGFAISDELAIIASPLENFRFEENDFNSVIHKTLAYINDYKNIDEIILGLPLRSNGSKSERTIMVEEFKSILESNLVKNSINIKIKLINEYGSTKDAESVMIQAGLSRKKRKNHKDKLAAAIILERYLN